jgi:hypothetical protein
MGLPRFIFPFPFPPLFSLCICWQIIFKNKAHLNFEAKKAVHPKIDLEEDEDKDNDKIDKPFDMSALTMPNYLRKAYRFVP